MILNKPRAFFIGEYLRLEQNVIRRASIELVYNIIFVSIVSLVIFFFVYLTSGFYYQLIKSVVIALLFTGLLFYIRYKKSIELICHLMLIISWSNNVINIYLFDDFNFFIALLTVCNILFAFHTLGSKTGIVYSILHFVPILVHFVLKGNGLILQEQPQQLAFSEGVITLVLIFFIITYLIYHYHQAYELARASVHQSVEEMRKAKEMAEEMNRLKTNFLSNMSHEIRTPINGILGISQVIEMETKDENILRYVNLQQESGKRLLNTITSILNLSRIEAEKDQLKLKVVDINKLISAVIGPLKELTIRKGLTLSFQAVNDPLHCLSDETMLYQVLTNIIGNAIKFTDVGSVEIISGISKERKDQLFIDIRDTGIGIADEFLPNLFSPFEQESSGRSRKYEGSGLGLSIAKKYIELLDGEIRVQSVKDKGSVFQIVLPVYNH